MKLNTLATLLALLSLFAHPVFAAWKDIPSADFTLEAFPAPGSEAYAKDFETLLKLQAGRSAEDCWQGKRMRFPAFKTLFQSELLDVTEMALVKPLMEQVGEFTERVAGYHKDKFDRPRPYDTNPRVKPCVTTPGGAKSYPSSHAAVASAVSCLLIEVFPEKTEDLKTFGQWLGDLRATIGLHHPSDVLAGQKLGAEICARLKADPDLREELQKLKKAALLNHN